MEQDLDRLAESLYDFVCANRADNRTKDGLPGDPRKVGCPYNELWDNVKDFYRNGAKWHLNQLLNETT